MQAEQLVQGDAPLGPVAHAVGDAGPPAALAALVPRPGQVQVGIEQGLEAALGHPDGHRHDAVGDLAHAAQVLPLHAGGLVPLLETAGLVDDADGAQRVGRQRAEVLGQAPLEAVAGLAVAPGGGGEELLEGADGGAAGQGDGLHALAGQVGEQAAAVAVEVGRGATPEEARAEVVQERGEGGAQASDVRIGHGDPPFGQTDHSTTPRPRAVILGARGKASPPWEKQGQIICSVVTPLAFARLVIDSDARATHSRPGPQQHRRDPGNGRHSTTAQVSETRCRQSSCRLCFFCYFGGLENV